MYTVALRRLQRDHRNMRSRHRRSHRRFEQATYDEHAPQLPAEKMPVDRLVLTCRGRCKRSILVLVWDSRLRLFVKGQ